MGTSTGGPRAVLAGTDDVQRASLFGGSRVVVEKSTASSDGDLPGARGQGKIITACTVSRGQSYRTHASPIMASTRNNTPKAADRQVPAGSVATRTADAAAVPADSSRNQPDAAGHQERGSGMAKPYISTPRAAATAA